MIAVIPAAGMATRLRPLTDNTPKCLLEIGGKSLLQRTIDALLSVKVDKIIIVTGYLNNKIEDFVNSRYPNVDIRFIHNQDYECTNNIYSLWLSQPEAEGKDMILLDSDIIFDPKILQRVLSSDAPDALALNRHELGEEEIKIILDENGYVGELNKTCNPADAIGESIGIEKMSANYTSHLFPLLTQMIEQEGLRNVFYEKAFERLAQKGLKFLPVDTTDLFAAELDTQEDFSNATEFIPSDLI
jgi:choline kinase